jgi:2-hydroxy-6-oxonona-2,4-dienedioate hydrolase
MVKTGQGVVHAGFVNVEGRHTRYLYEGLAHRDALLLVHGVGMSADLWVRNIDELSKTRRVVAPDLIGHGFTDANLPSQESPVPAMVAHLTGLMDNLSIEKAAIVGSSFGALIGAHLYLSNTQRFDAIVFVSSGSCFNTDEALARSYAAAFQNGASAMHDATLISLRRRLEAISFDARSVPYEVLPVQLTAYARPEVTAFYARLMDRLMRPESIREQSIWSRLHLFNVPVLIVSGACDPRADLERAAEASRRMPNARHVVIENCGHLPYTEYPKEFNSLISGFVESHKTNPGSGMLHSSARMTGSRS